MTRPTVVLMNWRFIMTGSACGTSLIVIRGGKINHFAFVPETNRGEQFRLPGTPAPGTTSSVKPKRAAFALGAGACPWSG